MGTNYYLETECCAACKRPRERLHIGKSSAGWCFSLRVDEEYTSLADWEKAWSQPNARIVDEYGEEILPREMLRYITERTGPDRRMSSAWCFSNGAEQGPNNLVRHELSTFCIGHGDSTYDLVTGEFC